MNETVFPSFEWERRSPEQAGFEADKLVEARDWIEEQLGGEPYRCVIVRGGYLIAEWYQGVSKQERLGLASAAKSVLSSLLGVAIAEGKIDSVDARLADVYPEALDVPEGRGPKPGRYAFDEDHAITLRQLISNTSGYMKPGEIPARVFHYQTYGMNITGHAIAKCYGLYDPEKRQTPDLQSLYKEKISDPIGANWSYQLNNFNLAPQARVEVFGNTTMVESNALDLARLGWLWCNWGRWQIHQVIPEGWLRQATRTAPDILANCAKAQWKYGYGFWTNDQGRLWPDLPRSGFTASGAGGHYVTVFPDQSLVIVQNPGYYHHQEAFRPAANPDLLHLILEALL